MKALATTLILGLVVLACYQYGQNQKQAKEINDRINEIVKLQEAAVGQQLEAQRKTLEDNKSNSLSVCLWNAEQAEQANLKLNAVSINKKNGNMVIPVSAMELANSRKATEIQECHLLYGNGN